MAPVILWYDNSDDPLATITLTAIPTTPGSATIIQAINEKDNASGDPLVSARLVALFRNVGQTDFKDSGTEWADAHYLEIRIEAGGWNNALQQSDWVKLGTGRDLPLPNLVYDQGIKFSIRLNIPAGVDIDTEEMSLRIVDSTSLALSKGITESGGEGIVVGVQDWNHSEIVSGGDVTEDSPTTTGVTHPDYVWLSMGRPFTAVAADVSIPLAAGGKARFDLLSLDVDGSGTVTKTTGSEVDSPAADSDKPAVPAGDIALAYVEVGDTSDIVDGDIQNVYQIAYYAFSSTGLTATLSRGPHALLDNSLTYNSASQNVALTASTTNYVWLLPSGGLSATTTTDAPADRAVLLWEATTDGSGVTATVDRRPLLAGRVVPITFRWDGTISTADYRYATLPGLRDAWLLPLAGIIASFGTQAVGGSALATVWDVEVNYSGSTWTTIFGTGATKPQIAYDAAAPDLVDVAAEGSGRTSRRSRPRLRRIPRMPF
jgi:hypothetical protein